MSPDDFVTWSGAIHPPLVWTQEMLDRARITRDEMFEAYCRARVPGNHQPIGIGAYDPTPSCRESRREGAWEFWTLDELIPRVCDDVTP